MDKEKKKIMATSYEKKRKKKMIMLSSVLAVLVIAMASFLIVTSMNKEETETTETEYIYMTDLKESEIIGIQYSYVTGEGEEAKEIDYSFEFRDSQWYYSADENFPVAQTTLTGNLIAPILKIQAGRKIENPENIEQYGLSKDVLSVVVTMKDGSKVELTAGNYNDTMGGFYMQKSGDDAVYLIGGTLEETFYERFREDVYEYATMDTVPAVSSETLKYVCINNGLARVELTYKEDGVEYDLINSSYWYFQAPFSRLMGTVDDKIEGAIDIITAVQFYKLADYEATEEELVEYGIKDSDKFYAINYYVTGEDEEGKEKTDLCIYMLEIGNLDESGEFYYTRPIVTVGENIEISNRVSCVEKTIIDELLGIDALDYVYRMASYVPFDNILGGHMDITIGDQTYKLVPTEVTEALKDGGEKKYKVFNFNGKDLSEEEGKYISDFYSDYMTSFFRQIIYDDSLIKEVDPVYTIEYTLVDQPFEKQIVQYTIYDDLFYQVTVDGYTDVLVSREDIDKAFANLDSLIK